MSVVKHSVVKGLCQPDIHFTARWPGGTKITYDRPAVSVETGRPDQSNYRNFQLSAVSEEFGELPQRPVTGRFIFATDLATYTAADTFVNLGVGESGNIAGSSTKAYFSYPPMGGAVRKQRALELRVQSSVRYASAEYRLTPLMTLSVRFRPGLSQILVAANDYEDDDGNLILPAGAEILDTQYLSTIDPSIPPTGYGSFTRWYDLTIDSAWTTSTWPGFFSNGPA